MIPNKSVHCVMSQVVQFLMNNTQMGDAVRFSADPLTGGGAYQPGSNPQTFSLDGLGAFGERSE